jgi:hypothetical protein
LSRSCWRTQRRSVSAVQPILAEIEQIAAPAIHARLDAPTPCARRARAPRGRNSVCSSWLHLLKRGSLLETRGGSDGILVCLSRLGIEGVADPGWAKTATAQISRLEDQVDTILVMSVILKEKHIIYFSLG